MNAKTTTDQNPRRIQYRKCNFYKDEDLDFNYLNIGYPIYHNHDCFEILIVTNGRIIHNKNGYKDILSSGAVSLIRPEDTHSILLYDENENTHHLSINITIGYMERLLSSYSMDLYEKIISLDKIPDIYLSDLEVRSLLSTILSIKTTDLETNIRTFQLKIIAEKLINKVLESAFPLKENIPDWFSNFLFKLSDPFIDTKKVDELTKYTPYSYSHLAPLFKKLTGKTIIEYIMESKIKGAQDLLKTTDMPISEIATKLNYESFSYFNRLFKKYSNISPSEYRKKYRL